MKEYYILSHDSNRDDLEVVSDYQLNGFDVTAFWTGETFHGNLPPRLRLTVKKGGASDFLGNPLSWPIISDRFWEQIKVLAEGRCQLVDVPLFYEGTESRVDGFSIMNVTYTVSAVHPDIADEELSISRLVLLRENIPSDTNIFRLAESSTLLVVSRAFVDAIWGKKLQGIALIDIGLA